MDLARDEMAFRKRYEALVVNKQLTTVFRPGNRIFPRFRGYKLDEIVTARIIEQPGSDEAKRPPLFNDIKIPIQIKEIKVLNVDELTGEDFKGSSPDVQTPAQLSAHLISIYSQPIHHFGDCVTKIEFVYLAR